MRFLFLVLALPFLVPVLSAENPYDSYHYAPYCPENGPAYENAPVTDENRFIRCQCTSHVAEMLSDRMTVRYYDNHAPNGLVRNFGNNSYYMAQDRRWTNGPNQGDAVTRWSHAVYWRDSALYAGIGVTGARDNFMWNEVRFDAVFPGDVAWWDAWDYIDADGKRHRNDYGHVAIVESAERDAPGRGVACVTLTEYNWNPSYEFNRRRVCKTDGHSFPDAFLHIDKDHAICTANPTRDNCQALWGGQMVASSGTKIDGLGGSGGDTPPTPLPNLQIEEITVHVIPEGDDTRLTEETSLMNLGQTYQINVWPVSHSADCQNGNMTGNPDLEVKTDTFFKIALSEDEGTWQLLKRSETHCKYLAHGDSKKEVIPVTIPPDAAGKRLYLKSETDATGDVAETDEGDNRSGIEWYPIQGACNLAISSARLTGQRVDLIQGENYGFAATLVNMGPDPCPRDTRLSYFYRKPIAGTDWILADGDDTPASKLVVGQSNEEWMTADTIIADTVGIHQARVCADTNDANGETNESDNCFTFLYAVNPPPPSNIVVTDPPPGATWRCSTKSDYQYIRWTGVTFAQSPTVELWYSLDNGASWKLIDAAVDNDGKYRWYMCKYPIGKDSSFGRVKVVAKYGGQAFSAISGQFFIDYARGCK